MNSSLNGALKAMENPYVMEFSIAFFDSDLLVV